LSSVSFPELFLLLVIGLLILGPERLPRVASQIGRWVGRARRTASQLRFQLEREIALADTEKKTPKAKASSTDKSGDKPGASNPASADSASPASQSGSVAKGESATPDEPAQP
jgi:sec-independent protein translocase protein TatB